MAVVVGTQLTRELVAKFKRESKRSRDEVVLLASVDERGFPNISLLSYLDVSVVSPRKLLLAIGERSSTKKNLLRDKKGTLVLWGGKKFGLFYLKGKIRIAKERLETRVEGITCSALVFSIWKVSQDNIPTAKLLSTITYDTTLTNFPHHRLFKELSGISGRI